MFGNISQYVEIATKLLEAIIELAKLTRENTEEVKRNNQLLISSKQTEGQNNG